MEKIYCELTGKDTPNMRLKLLLRLLNLFLLIIIRNYFGIDYALLLLGVFAVADLDAIAESLAEKVRKKKNGV